MGVRPSMGSVGDAYDNAMAESFFASLECELINRRSWKNKTEARLAIFTWIESWYNPIRRHSGLGYLSPNNFERKLKEKNQIAINCNPLSQVETLSTCEKMSVKLGQLQIWLKKCFRFMEWICTVRPFCISGCRSEMANILLIWSPV
ncbi:integrase-like protein [Nitrosomonas oligotropha]|nr:integrase-like protein [Nitrosomonas oligotropha]